MLHDRRACIEAIHNVVEITHLVPGLEKHNHHQSATTTTKPAPPLPGLEKHHDHHHETAAATTPINICLRIHRYVDETNTCMGLSTSEVQHDEQNIAA